MERVLQGPGLLACETWLAMQGLGPITARGAAGSAAVSREPELEGTAALSLSEAPGGPTHRLPRDEPQGILKSMTTHQEKG